MDFLLFSIVLSSILSIVQNQSVSTIPDTSNGDAFITADEGAINVTVVCTMFNSGLNQIVTLWRIQREGEDQALRDIGFSDGGVPTITEFIGDLFATGKPLPGISGTFLTNFTFLNFSSQFDTTHLQCGETVVETRNVFLGFPG